MRNIAVACTADGRLSLHFGRSTHFQIFTVEGTEIRAITTANVQAVTQTIGIGHGRPHADDQGHHHHHGHGPLLQALDGCDTVLAGGMGEGVAGSLRNAGLDVVVAAVSCSPEDAVMALLEGRLEQGEIHACCRHRHAD